jgi:nucleoside-diphosphate-sugar epimerase
MDDPFLHDAASDHPPIALVTGAAGFIGVALCRTLRSRGWRVRALLRRPIGGPWDYDVQLDLGTQPVPPSFLEGVDTVFHLAGKAHAVSRGRVEWDAYRRSNFQSTLDLLGAARSSGVRCFVYMSSVKAGDIPEPRADDPAPADPYAQSKRLAEEAVLGSGALPHPVVLRPALVYGPHPKGYLKVMIKAVRGGWFPLLPDTGNARSMVHRDDLVEAALRCAIDPRARRRTYVVTDGHPYSTREIYEMILAALGRRRPSWEVPLGMLRVAAFVGDLGERLSGHRLPFDSEVLGKLTGSALYDGRAIEDELGFHAALQLKDAIGEMIATTP